MRRMQPLALAGQQVVVDGAAQEVVREGVASAVRRQQSLGHGDTQRLVHDLVSQPDHLAQQPVGHGVRDDRGGAHDCPRIAREPVQPADEQVRQRAR